MSSNFLCMIHVTALMKFVSNVSPSSCFFCGLNRIILQDNDLPLQVCTITCMICVASHWCFKIIHVSWERK